MGCSCSAGVHHRLPSQRCEPVLQLRLETPNARLPAAPQALSQDCLENQLALARVGAISPLAALLGSESDDTQLYAQGALLNIAVAQVRAHGHTPQSRASALIDGL